MSDNMRSLSMRVNSGELGWSSNRILIIDEDQGISGKSADNRPGFQRLLSEVSLKHVGLVLGLELSRLPDRPTPNFDDPLWHYAPYNIFHWSLTQKHSVIDGHLANFKGSFVGDATGANARLAARTGDNRIDHQNCKAHARRYFVKAQSNDTVLASQMIAMYRQIYAVEYRAASLSVAERLELRQRDAVPIWQRMRAWLDQDEVKRLLPKSDIGEAAGYLRNQWDALRLYLSDGRLPIDNNHSERVIRLLTIGRKNWMFLGSVAVIKSYMVFARNYAIAVSIYGHSHESRGSSRPTTRLNERFVRR